MKTENERKFNKEKFEVMIGRKVSSELFTAIDMLHSFVGNLMEETKFCDAFRLMTLEQQALTDAFVMFISKLRQEIGEDMFEKAYEAINESAKKTFHKTVMRVGDNGECTTSYAGEVKAFELPKNQYFMGELEDVYYDYFVTKEDALQFVKKNK